MDAFDIASMMRGDRQPQLKKRFGTVKAVLPDGYLSVLVAASKTPVPVVRACDAVIGDKVILLVDGTQWFAIATIGGDKPTVDLREYTVSGTTLTMRVWASAPVAGVTIKAKALSGSTVYTVATLGLSSGTNTLTWHWPTILSGIGNSLQTDTTEIWTEIP